MFKYNIYGINIQSSIPLSSMREGYLERPIAQINFLYKNERPISQYAFLRKGKSYDFNDGTIRFAYDDGQKQLIAYCEDINMVSSLLPGLPFVAIVLNEGGLLMHTSAILQNEKAILFMGPKGMGKSTLAFSLHKKYPVTLLADDSIAIYFQNGSACVYNGVIKMKLTKEIVEYNNLDKEVSLTFSSEEKFYYTPSPLKDYHNEPYPLKIIFVLNRMKDITSAEITPINKHIAPIYLLRGAFVPSMIDNLYTEDLVKVIDKFINKVKIMKLSFRDGLEFITHDSLYERICNCE